MFCLTQQASSFNTQSHNQSCAMLPVPPQRPPAAFLTPVSAGQLSPHTEMSLDSSSSFFVPLRSTFEHSRTLALWQPTQEFPGW